MKCMRLIPCIALLLLVAPLLNAKAQIRDPLISRIATAPDTSATALLRRIEALESTIAQLQQKLAFIKSANPLVLETGGDLTIRGNQVLFEAQMGLIIRAGSNANISSSSHLSITAGTILDLYGRSLRHNGGTAPIACAPPPLSQVVACDNTVTMMGPLR